ncbi:MAG: divergent polysaccharide deacetylase family protein [Deltaproteobacteria bacterium]|nr:divergent polysaccharide deacetylase family protein [Deltaproteobacteria bacterium]
MKDIIFVRFLRLAARHPALWTGLTAGCLLAAVLLATLALWPGTDSPDRSALASRALVQRESGAAPGAGGSPVPDEEPAPLPEKSPRRAGLAIVMDDVGENMQAVHALLALRIPLAFAVWPHAGHTRETALAAHAAGCAVLIHQPMEALDAAARPGPNPLRTGMPRERMEAVLWQSLARVPHAEGLNNHMGSRFTTRSGDVRLFCEIMADSGLFVLDSVTHPASVLYEEARAAGIPAARRDIFLDAEPAKAAVLARLREAERLALHGRQVIAIGHPRAATLAALREWNSARDPALRLLDVRDCLTPP